MITCIRAPTEAMRTRGLQHRRRSRSIALVPLALALALALALGAPKLARGDTVASLLGNFTVNQYCGLNVASERVDVHYAVVFGQLPALRELHLADANSDGVTSQAERDAYVGRIAPALAEGLELRVNGALVPFRAVRWTSSLPSEQGGFSLRVEVDFTADVPAAAAGSVQELQFDNKNFPGRLGWHEIVVEAGHGKVSVFDTDAYDTSLTGGLREALQALPATGPLDERAVHFSIALHAPPQARVLAARPGTVTTVASARDDTTAKGTPRIESDWIASHTRQLVDVISSPRLEPRIIVLALLGALLLGAVHALSPGHGKTIVGAYLIGSRGTPRHAVFLGLTVTITHTIGVFVLGFATLYASRFIVPERLFPILSLISAVLVLGMGVVLLIQRGRAAREVLSRPSSTVPRTPFQRVVPSTRAATGARGLIFAPNTALADPTLHSHGGGRLHSHLPPGAAGEPIDWRSLLTLGISGGLVPCPSAMVLLLAAVALNKTVYGMLLVVAFSIGLAITLTVVGLAFLYARNRFRKPNSSARWPLFLPVLSAVTITLLGAALCVGALKSFG
jgi:nickel/cobalt transporter (NicO) family protein